MTENNAVSILKYWLDVEAAAPSVQASREHGADLRVVHVNADGWSDWAFDAAEGNRVVAQVRLGLFCVQDAAAELAAAVGGRVTEGADPFQQTRDEYGYLATFVVGRDGVPVAGSFRLSAFGWKFACLRGDRAVGPDVSDFRRFEAAAADRFDAGFCSRVDGAPTLSADWPVRTSDFVRSLFRSPPRSLITPSNAGERPLALVRQTRSDRKGAASVFDVGFVNSTLLDDIERVIAAGADGYGRALSQYLGDDVPAERRIDLLADGFAGAVALSAPGRLPLGKWPSRGDDPAHGDAKKALALMQQVAVNAYFSEVRPRGGLLSVNGPPGTGKTTLIRDIVAGEIVERARVMAGFVNPADAFKPFKTVGVGREVYEIWSLDERLRATGIVVASSNNKAVENITTELPLAKNLAASASGLEYHRETAQALMPGTAPAWGLVSAALGNGENKSRVVRALTGVAGKDGVRPPDLVGDLVSGIGASVDGWRDAVERFRARLDAVERRRREMVDLDRLPGAIAEAALQAARRREESGRALERLAVAEAALQAVGVEHARRVGCVADVDREIAALHVGKPGFIEVLLDWSATKRWRRRFEEAVERRSAADGERLKAENRRAAAEAEAGALRSAAAAAAAQAEAADKAVAADDRRLAALRVASPSDGLTPERFSAMTDAERHQGILHVDHDFDRLREALFAAAVDVHRLFAANSGGRMGKNIALFLRHISGLRLIKDRAGAEGVRYLWDTFFLLCPVVSTTFASLSTMFGDEMGRDSIGLLVVDEAGQAVPQAAAGAMWRSRRAVVVGDPQQIEPVSTIEESLSDVLMTSRGVTLRHDSKRRSVQTVADGANHYGGVIIKRDPVIGFREAWVGCPLKVHRRCVEPMFSIANSVSYGGSMVLGTGLPDESGWSGPKPTYGPGGLGSCWLDISGSAPTSSHWIEDQGAKALEIIREMAEFARTSGDVEMFDERGEPRRGLHSLKNGMPALFVISPFRSVAETLRGEVRRRRGDLFPGVPDREVEAWIATSIGTTHTFQGAEAETVLFVLGGNPTKPGAIRAMADTPNLLNVAATRARRRFYVVGDQVIWTRNGPTTFGAIADMRGFPTVLAEPAFVRSIDDKSDIERVSTLVGHLRVLEQAFSSAKSMLVVTSPYITKRALSHKSLCVPTLIAKAVERGIKIGVYLDPTQKPALDNPSDYAAAKAMITAAGGIIREAAGLHNKTIVVDDTEIIEGSFNWLSAVRDPGSKHQNHECSLRYCGPKAAEFCKSAISELRSKRVDL